MDSVGFSFPLAPIVRAFVYNDRADLFVGPRKALRGNFPTANRIHVERAGGGVRKKNGENGRIFPEKPVRFHLSACAHFSPARYKRFSFARCGSRIALTT